MKIIYKELEKEVNEINRLLNIESPRTIKELETFINKYLGKPYLKLNNLDFTERHIMFNRRAGKVIEVVCKCCNESFTEYVEYETIIEFSLTDKVLKNNNTKNIPINNIRIYIIADESTYQVIKNNEEDAYEENI